MPRSGRDCCIIRSKTSHPGVEAKRRWLSERLSEGHVFMEAGREGYGRASWNTAWPTPKLSDKAKKMAIESKALTIYYDMQCPYVSQSVETVRRHCEESGVPLSLIRVDTLRKAKELPCVFNNWAAFYKGSFETVNLLDVEYLKRILKK